jgi:hypothetical protein
MPLGAPSFSTVHVPPPPRPRVPGISHDYCREFPPVGSWAEAHVANHSRRRSNSSSWKIAPGQMRRQTNREPVAMVDGQDRVMRTMRGPSGGRKNATLRKALATTSSRHTVRAAMRGACCRSMRWSPKARDSFACRSVCTTGIAVRSGSFNCVRQGRQARQVGGSRHPAAEHGAISKLNIECRYRKVGLTAIRMLGSIRA